MENIFTKFCELITSFDKSGVEYILIGGLAINLHGFTRNTQEIDLFVNLEKKNIEKLQTSLFEVFDDNDIYEITFKELKKHHVIQGFRLILLQN